MPKIRCISLMILAVLLLSFNVSFSQPLNTIDTLNVLSLSPQPNTDFVDAGKSRITVMFDRSVVPVNALAQPDANAVLTITPALQGSGSWVHPAVYEFVPEEDALHGGITYTVGIDPTLQAVDGAVFAAPVEWSFTVIEPQVIDIVPTHQTREGAVLRESGFTISFTQPMDPVSTEAAFTLYKNLGGACGDGCSLAPQYWKSVDGTFSWNDEHTQLIFTPTQLLDYGYNQYDPAYRVALAATARNAHGSAVLIRDTDEFFRPVYRPGVASTSPVRGGSIAPGKQRVIIDFLGVIDTESLRGRFTITPAPSGEVTPYVNNHGRLRLVFDHVLYETYTITILPGVRDVYGSVMTDSYSFIYEVREPQPEPSAFLDLPENRGFVIAGSYLDQVSVPLVVRGEADVNFATYRTNADMIMDAVTQSVGYYGATYGDIFYRLYQTHSDWTPLGMSIPSYPRIPWRTEENLVSRVTRSFNIENPEGETVHVPLTEDDARLPLGFYGVDMSHQSGFVMAVANAGVTVWRSHDEILVWVTDYITAQPLADVPVQARGKDLRVTGRTDSSGIVRLTIPTDEIGNGFLLITTESDDYFGAWYSESAPAINETVQPFLYSDRRIYRPGETINYRGILRNGSDLRYTVPSIDTVYASLDIPCYGGYSCPSETSVYRAELAVTDFGTFSDSFVLPADLSPGYYQVSITECAPDAADCRSVHTNALYFQVAEFRVPDVKVELTPQHDEIVSGDPVYVDVYASFYSGSPLTNGTIARNGQGWSTSFIYRGHETGFTFGDNELTGTASIYVPDARMPVGSDGHTLLFDAPVASGSYPVNFWVEATVTDPSGQAISASTRMIIHPANLYIGLRSSTLNVTGLKPVQIDIMTLFPDSVLRPSQPVQIEIIERRVIRTEESFGRYSWHTEEYPVETVSLTTDSAGGSVYTFVPPRAGIYRLRATGMDERGYVATTAINMVVDSEDEQQEVLDNPFVGISCEIGEPIHQLKVTTDKELYLPSDVAELSFQNPYGVPVTVVITIERQTIRQMEMVTVTGKSYTHRLRVDASDAPNVIMHLVMLRPAGLSTPHPAYLFGRARVPVDNKERRLNLRIIPPESEVAPGDTVSFDLYVSDHNGSPVSAEIGVALTDLAVLDLTYDYRLTQEGHYYPHQNSGVMHTTSSSGLLHNVDVELGSYCGQGGGGGAPSPTLRNDFVYTPLWEPHVVTDENGFASVSLKMPDNLTQWELTAMAITTDTKVGEAETMIRTSLPLVARANAPRFFTVGDTLPLSALIQNNTDAPVKVEVRLDVRGFMLQNDNAIQSIEVPANSLQRVEWWGTVEDSSSVYMAVYAISDNGLSDASIPTLTTGEGDTIPVYAFHTVDTFTFSGSLDEAESQTEVIDLRLNPAPQSAYLTVELAPTLADVLTHHVNAAGASIDSYTSTLTVASMLRMNTTVLAFSPVRSTLSDDLQQDIRDQIETALNWLVSQQRLDGGWGWYKSLSSDAALSASVLIGLTEARVLGFVVDAQVMERAADFLARQLAPPHINTPLSEMEAQVALLYALSLYSPGEEATDQTLLALFEMRHELTTAGRAQLLLVYLNTYPDSEQTAALVTDLTSAAIISGNSVHWEQDVDPDHIRPADTRTTAVALYALLKAQPSHPLTANAVRWLVTASQSGGQRASDIGTWLTTAMGEWLRQTNDHQPDFAYGVYWNGSEWSSSFNTEDLAPVHWSPTGKIPLNQQSELTIERSAGSGSLYYNGELTLNYAAEDVDAVARGVRIEREYLRDRPLEAIASPTVGDVVVVRITVYVMRDLYYFTLQDTLPAGLDPLDPSLLTTTDLAQEPTLRSANRNNPYWYWGYIYWGRTQLEDTGIKLQATYLPRGVYTYTYQARAVTSGTYMIPPAHAYAAQQPDVIGRTKAAMMTIQAP